MRIVAVQTGLEADSVLGGEITDREFLTRLADRGVQLHVLATEGHEIVQHRNLVPHYYKRRFYRRVPYSANLDVAIDLRHLLAELGRVDWVRFNSPYSVGIGTVAAARRHRIWGSYLHCEDDRFWRWTDSWLPKRCALVTCLSEDTRRDVLQRCPGVDRSRVTVVPLGIDTTRHDNGGRPRDQIRAELGFAATDIVILFAGLAVARKGIPELIAAWQLLGNGRPIRLLIISKPVAPYESELIATLTRSDSRVKHLTRVAYERMPEYFRASDIFFFPTRREGFGLVLGEAMANGLPVATTRARGVREVVAENETALLADVGDVQQLAANLERLIQDRELRRQLGTAGRERVTRMFRWDTIIDALLGTLAQ
ncbi:MAG: glycosyltransferase family 4 protein [Chloroflexi bacterium]|nr:MAG: glycosyltransferase family 4 protein [Chloroflexota bacterium]